MGAERRGRVFPRRAWEQGKFTRERPAGGPPHYFWRFATHSLDCFWPSRSRSWVPVMVSSFSVPLYAVVNFWPSRSRVTLKLILSPSILASAMGVSVLL